MNSNKRLLTLLTLSCSAVCATTFGINISEAECTWGSFAGAKDLAFLSNNGITLLRVPIAWERIQPRLNKGLDQTYLAELKAFIQLAGSQGMQVIVDLHNFARYDSAWASKVSAGKAFCTMNGDVLGSAALPASALTDVWNRLSSALANTSGLAYYDVMNEPHDLPAGVDWPSVVQSAINAIRKHDTKTTLLVEGVNWSAASSWPQLNGNLLLLNDPAGKLVYEAHQYFDADNSSRYLETYDQQGAYPNIGVDRVQPFLNWLAQNHVNGFLGEFSIPNNDPRWFTVLDNFLAALKTQGVSGTFWTLVFHAPTDPATWPYSDKDPKFILSGQPDPRLTDLQNQNSTP